MRAYFISLLFILFLFPATAHALSVDALRFGVHPDKTRLVLELSDITDFRVFMLDNPYRMVIDLPAFDWHAQSPEVIVKDTGPKTGIRAVRHGNLKPGISRIVFDLSGPAAVQGAFILPRQSGKPDRLVIDFSNTGAASFQSVKNQIHGTLSVDQASVVYSTSPTSGRTAGNAGASPPPPMAKPAQQKPHIIIDPGHGGVDPGAISKNGLREKDVVLKLAKNLKQQLESSGQYRVTLTRDSDVFIKLADRVKFARKHGGDLFLSIHADSINKSHVQGASIYTLSEKASDAQTAKLAARENKADLIAGIDLSVEDEEVASILVDLAMRDTTNQSKFFANTLVDYLQSNQLETLDSPHRYAGFAVLKAPDIPSILIEAGFMSNNQEASRLNTPEYRRKIARAIKDGIDAYFAQVRKNQRI